MDVNVLLDAISVVGFPIIRNIDRVFAATNSAIMYGTGSIFAFAQKQHINGVKVKITISLEVKTVRTETITYKSTNSRF